MTLALIDPFNIFGSYGSVYRNEPMEATGGTFPR